MNPILARLAGLFVRHSATAAYAAAGLVALVLYTGVVWRMARHDAADHVQARTVAKVQAATVRETVRRETVLRKVQIRAARDVAEIDRLNTRLVVLQEESRRASLGHDADRCLSPDSVLRLAAVH